MYADVILPVPLQGLFTYAVPEGMTVGEGMRVLVGFGRSKTYVGLVARVHHVKPQGYEVKPIQQQIDQQPMVTPQRCGIGSATTICRPSVRCTRRLCPAD